MNYLILGAGGFIGTKLSQVLFQYYGKCVYFAGLEIDEQLPKEQRFDGLIKDFSKFDDIAISELTILYLLNTVSPSTTEPNDSIKDTQLLTSYLEWAREKKIAHTIFTSSGGTIYQNHLQTPIIEESPLAPLSFYGMSKLCSEEYIRFYHRRYGLNYTILRIANPYGPGQKFIRNQGLIPAVLDRVMKNEPVTILGDGSMVRDYLYIDDLTDAMVRVAESEAFNTELNVGSGQGTSVLQVVDNIEGFFNYKIQREYTEHNPNLPQSNVLDISKISQLINWQPKTPFSVGLDNYIMTIL